MIYHVKLACFGGLHILSYLDVINNSIFFAPFFFQGTDAVQLALKLNNTDLMGRKIRVKRCLPGGAQSTQKDAASFKPKMQSQKPGKLKKKMSFVGETADATKSKNKKPKTKKKKMK